MDIKLPGISLVEGLLLVCVLGVLSVVSFSFASDRVNRNRVLEGENHVTEAFSRAKSAAYQNSLQGKSVEPVVVICRSDSELSIRDVSGKSTAANCTTSNVLWRIDLHRRLGIKANGTDFVCACLNGEGQITTRNCSACTSASTVSLRSGSKRITVALR
ncbi:hypothetical protein [Teredinibacter franksiae]|uniref:hypothetical protein n=1 Tax=Teredinibacter franksiae TaxID=2761453 RepID=UPI0016278A8E|nr:hypothetical protein [Teredinibacter franksiae]